MNFILKEAVVTLGRAKDRNTFQVRVLPDMAEIAETDLLPYYPNFFAKDDIAYKPRDVVWVVCSEDFLVGFILGQLQPPAGSDMSSAVKLVNMAEDAAGFPLSSFSDLSITRMSGASLTFENRLSGQTGTIYNTKVLFIVSKDGDAWFYNPTTTVAITKNGDIAIKGKSLTEDVNKHHLKSGDSLEEVASKKVSSSGSIINSASGDLKNVTSSNRFDQAAGDSEELVAKNKKETFGTGKKTTIVSGGDDTTIIAGDFSMLVTLGSVKITSSLGMDFKSAGPITLTSTMIELKAATIKAPTGVVAPSAGPFCALPFCLYSGAPHSGNISVGVPT